jgi:RHS repeat-associated protein
VWQGTFLPYGEEYNPQITTNNYKFTGKERDSETGLDYFGARYYGNGLGRFLTPDWAAKAAAVPYGEFSDPQSLNLYTYVRNIPTTRADADGHQCMGCPIDPDKIAIELAPQELGMLWDSAKDLVGKVVDFLNEGVKQNYENYQKQCSCSNVYNNQSRSEEDSNNNSQNQNTSGEKSGQTSKLDEARTARDDLAKSTGKSKATVTAGYNTETGEVAASACAGGKCAEDKVVEALGGDKSKVKFTEAIRPRTGKQVPVCERCEATYGRDAFPPDTQFKSEQKK